ncbi:TraR/DksA C4-type zinc finger protein [Alkaliphilus crotonatoxidans]
MKSHQLIYFKGRLLEEKQSILKTLERMEAHETNQGSLREYTEELSAYDNHPGDLGTETFMVEMNANLENHERYRLAEIDRALEKIEKGTYGSCSLCGTEIPTERLDLIPEVSLCMECAKEKLPLEDLQGDRGRPGEESRLYPAFERTNMDEKDYTGFDGEDSYQQVAKFNEVKNDPSFSTGDHFGIFDEDSEGIVQEVEGISEEEYRNQLYYQGGVKKFRRKR